MPSAAAGLRSFEAHQDGTYPPHPVPASLNGRGAPVDARLTDGSDRDASHQLLLALLEVLEADALVGVSVVELLHEPQQLLG